MLTKYHLYYIDHQLSRMNQTSSFEQKQQKSLDSSSNSQMQLSNQSTFIIESSKDADEKVLTQSIKSSLNYIVATQNYHRQSSPVQIQNSINHTIKQQVSQQNNSSFSTLLSNDWSHIHYDAHINAIMDNVEVLKNRSIRRQAEILRLADLLKKNGIEFQIDSNLSFSKDQINNSQKSAQQHADITHYKKKYEQYKTKCKRYQQKLRKLKQIAE